MTKKDKDIIREKIKKDCAKLGLKVTDDEIDYFNPKLKDNTNETNS